MSSAEPRSATFLRRSAPSLREISFSALYALVVVVVTLLRDHDRVGLAHVAATPAALTSGRPWLLLTSGLLVEGDLPLSVLGVVTLSLAVLVVCGSRVLWGAGILGHVGSALGTYVVLASVSTIAPERTAHLRHAPDYGVSAFVAGGLGALAVGAWHRRAEWPLSRLWPVLAGACIGATVLMTLHVLDQFWFEHVPAFAIGGGVAFVLGGRAPTVGEG